MKKSVPRVTAVKPSPARAGSTTSRGRAQTVTGQGRRPLRELCVTILHALDAWEDAIRAPTLVHRASVRTLIARARTAATELSDRIRVLPPSRI